MFADLTWERETEILIAAFIHEEIQTAALAQLQLQPVISGSLSLSSSQVL